MLSSLRTATCVALMTVGWAAAAEAQTTASHLKIKGDAVHATFFSVDPTNCIETTVFVISHETTRKVSPGQKTTTIATELVVTRFDVCTGLEIFFGEGTGAVTNLRIAGNLRTATVTDTVAVVDNAGSTHLFTVNLTWAAIGPAVRNHEHELFRDEDLGLFINSQVRGKLVPAVATGIVSGLGDNWTPEPSTSAEILTQNVGQVIIERGL